MIWRSNKKGWISTNINQVHITRYLSVELAMYVMGKNLPKKFLLLDDIGPSHPPSMHDWTANIEVVRR